MAKAHGATLPMDESPVTREVSLQVVQDDDAQAQMLERLARDPNVSVDKIERLMALWERAEAKKAEAAFNASMSLAQKAMRPVSADASNPQTHSRYASYAALDRVLRPIYTEHGFGLSFNTGADAPAEYVRVLCEVTHLGGFSKHYTLDMPADGKGAKGGDVMTKTHAAGSAVSYGMRYLLKMIFNVAVGEDDDDGNAAGRTEPLPSAPKGFEEWLTDLVSAADEGFDQFKAAWNPESAEPYRVYLAKTQRGRGEALKRHAMDVTKAQKAGAK